MRIAIGGDHGAVVLKSKVVALLETLGHTTQDFGTFSNESCDYNDFAYLAAKSVADGINDRAIVICSTGIGVSIVANKVSGIRCALVTDTNQARLTREHNNTNALALGVMNTSMETALEIVKIWVATPFSNEERHIRRINKIDSIGRDYHIYKAEDVVFGMSLKNEQYIENNNMALYTALDKEGVIENRRRLFSSMGISENQVVFPNQTHSTNVVKITKNDGGRGFSDDNGIQDCDALYTFEKNVVLGVFHADCVPVMMYDKNKTVVAIAHSSKIATEKQLVVQLINQLNKEGINTKDIYAYVGVGVSDVDGKRLSDIVVEQLQACGIEHITQAKENTDTDNYFSFKLNDHERHLSFIYRK